MSSTPYTLKLSETIRNEWRVRNIAEVIPTLDGAQWDNETSRFDADTMRAIAADARWMMNPKHVDTHPGERAAYRALAKQCERMGF